MPNAARAPTRQTLPGMNTRHLFLVGYDISENPRRRRALRDVQHHALGGQKSFYECWLFAFSLSRPPIALAFGISAHRASGNMP